MPSGGLDYKRATDVAKFIAEKAVEVSRYVTLDYTDLVAKLTEAYQQGWDEAIRAKEARDERG